MLIPYGLKLGFAIFKLVTSMWSLVAPSKRAETDRPPLGIREVKMNRKRIRVGYEPTFGRSNALGQMAKPERPVYT